MDLFWGNWRVGFGVGAGCWVADAAAGQFEFQNSTLRQRGAHELLGLRFTHLDRGLFELDRNRLLPLEGEDKEENDFHFYQFLGILSGPTFGANRCCGWTYPAN